MICKNNEFGLLSSLIWYIVVQAFCWGRNGVISENERYVRVQTSQQQKRQTLSNLTSLSAGIFVAEMIALLPFMD